nr:acyltransferase [Polaromonas sp. A23]
MRGGIKINDSRNFWLDACRSAAIAMVLLSHGRHFLTPIFPDLHSLRIGGFLGVELFFVLSGFLVGTIAWRHFQDASKPWVTNFVVRRWMRTLPSYYLFLLVNFALIAYAIAPGSVSDLALFAIFAQNLISKHPPVFGEAWSLAAEEVFYLILPLSLLLLGKTITSRKSAFLTATTLLVLIPLVLRHLKVEIADPSWDEGIRKIVVFRLDALMFGVLAGWLSYEYAVTKKVKAFWLFICSTAILLSAAGLYFSAGKDIDSSYFARVWLFPMVSLGFSLLLLGGLDWNKAPAWARAFTDTVARWSYSLYLAHMPVFHLIYWCFGSTPEGDLEGALVRWLGFILASLAIAALVERFFERPVLVVRDKFIPR